jgi:exopolysaccharide biosynthesis polyprenyl glycosylphosphotransferase
MARPLRPSERTFLIALCDTAAAVVAVVLAMWTWSITAGEPLSRAFIQGHTAWFLAVPIWTVALSPTRQSHNALAFRVTAEGLLHASGALFVAYLVAYFYAGPDVLPRLMAVYVLWNAAWLTLGGRLVLLWTLSQQPFARRLLIVGEGPAAVAAQALMTTPGLHDVTVVEVIGGPERPASEEPGRPGLQTRRIDERALHLGATEVVIAMSGPVPAETMEQLLKCQEAGVDVVTFDQLYEQTLHRVPVRHVGHDWLLTQLFSGAGPRDASPIAKRLLDVGAALALGVAGAIPGALAGIAILLESGRPVFYSQVRLGRAGRHFRLTKFRTMRGDAEAGGPQWSPENDPRITRVGRILRRTHIDELPNLWAVLRGDMSMTGPRPERPEFIEMLEREVPLYRARLTVAPGLTGWAQVNTEYGDSVEDATTKLEYDLYYIRHRSFWFDVSIMARTAGRMLGWRGR